MSDLIKEARELCEAATPGPWETYMPEESNGWCYLVPSAATSYDIVTCYGFTRREQPKADMAFIVAARTLVPKLLDEIEHLRNRLDQAEYAITTVGLKNVKAGRFMPNE